MNPKPRPNHRLHLESLRRMTEAQWLLKAFELTEFTRQLFKDGLRERFPDKTEVEVDELIFEKNRQKSANELYIYEQSAHRRAEPY
jgi:hypothetical protein